MKMKRMFKKLLVMSLLVLALCGSALTVYADESDSSSTTLSSASSEERNRIRGQLNRFYTDLKSLNDISDENKKKMDKIYNTAMSYMNYADLSVSEIASYESTVEGYLKDLANKNTADTNKFLMLSNEVPITDAKYGDTAFVVLSLINLGKTDITDIVIGLPKNMDGSLGFASERTFRFCKLLEKLNKNVVMEDERLTSIEAQKILLANEISAKNSKNYIDMQAAVIILEDYLRSINEN